jgi:hypothetical protein
MLSSDGEIFSEFPGEQHVVDEVGLNTTFSAASAIPSEEFAAEISPPIDSIVHGDSIAKDDATASQPQLDPQLELFFWVRERIMEMLEVGNLTEEARRGLVLTALGIFDDGPNQDLI